MRNAFQDSADSLGNQTYPSVQAFDHLQLIWLGFIEVRSFLPLTMIFHPRPVFHPPPIVFSFT